MFLVGFEPAIPVIEQSQTHTLDRVVFWDGALNVLFYVCKDGQDSNTFFNYNEKNLVTLHLPGTVRYHAQDPVDNDGIKTS
jgi:hypothetical protein